MKALYLFPSPRSEMIEKIRAGTAPNQSLFGMLQLRRYGIEAEHIDVAHSRVPGLSPTKMLMYVLPRLPDYDVLITTAGHGPILATLQRLALTKARKPHIYICIQKLDRLLNRRLQELIKQKYGIRYFLTELVENPRFIRFGLRTIDRIVVLANTQKKPLQQLLGVSDEKLEFIPLGIDHNFFRPTDTEPKNFVISCGADASRDYLTLVKAIEPLNHKFVVVCGPNNLRGIKLPGNMEVYVNLDYKSLRQLYGDAQFGVIPLYDTYASGHTVVLELMAMGKALIVSATKGILDYVEDGKTGLLVEPCSPAKMRSAIQYFLDNPSEFKRMGKNARARVENNFTSEHFARRLADTIRTVSSST